MAQRSVSLAFHLAAGGLTAIVGMALFAAAHALFIIPIWSRLASGVPFALIAALAVVWAHYDLLRAGRLELTPRDGVLLGAGVWLLFLPATAIGVLARLTGLHQRAEMLETVLEVGAALAMGALLGWRLNGWRSAISGAVAALAILAAVGGPVPLTLGRRAIAIWLALLAILALAGVCQTLLLKVSRAAA